MSPSDDYEDDMRHGIFSDSDVELLLSGETPESPELLHLAPLVEMLRTDGLHAPDEASTQRYAPEAAEIVRASKPSRPAVTPARRRLLPRLAGALAAALLLTGLTGVAVASDGAAPGDPLYGIDRALENVGVGAGGPGERLAEASVLANNGKAAEALAHAAEAISQNNSQAIEALDNAATHLSQGSENAADAHARVAVMLGCIADAHGNGIDFGQDVAECARGFADPETQNENNGNGPPEGLPPVLPEGLPPVPPDGVPPGPPDGVPPVGLGGPGA